MLQADLMAPARGRHRLPASFFLLPQLHTIPDKRSVRYEDAYIKNNQSYNYLKREVMGLF